MQQSSELADFVDALASGDPTPGGGSAAALAGALGAALAAMVARLTVGRQRYAAVDEEMQRIVVTAEGLRQQLTSLVARDAAAYEEVRSAVRLPKESETDKTTRYAAIQAALKTASRTPLETVIACLAVLRLCARVAEVGNRNAATDACAGALLTHAGLQAAVLNVRTNLADTQDAAFTAHCETTVAEALVLGQQLLQQTLHGAGQAL